MLWRHRGIYLEAPIISDFKRKRQWNWLVDFAYLSHSPVHTVIKGRQVHPLIRFLLRSRVDEKCADLHKPFISYLFLVGTLHLEVYVAAIAAHHDAVDGLSLGKHDLIVRFLKGARRMNPSRPSLVPSWVPLYCPGWTSEGPLWAAGLLSVKTALLTALTSIKKVGDLQAFSVSEECLVFGSGLLSRCLETPAWKRAQGSHHALLRSGGEPASTALGGGRSSLSVAVSHKSIAHIHACNPFKL